MRGGEQAADAIVAGLLVEQIGEALRGLARSARLEFDRGEQQLPRGRVVKGAVGAVPQAARELEIAGAGGEHRLQIKGRRMAAGEPKHFARVGEHVVRPTHVAIGGGAGEQRGAVLRIDLERAIEPGQSGGEAILAAGEFAAQHQSVAIALVRRDCPVGGLERAGNVAIAPAEAGDVDPRFAVVRGERGRAIEGGAGVGAAAQRQRSEAADALRISLVRRVRPRGLGERAGGVGLEQTGLGEQMRGVRDRRSRLARPNDLGLRADAVVVGKLDPRLHDPRLDIGGVRLDRVQELDPGGAQIPLLEGGKPRA